MTRYTMPRGVLRAELDGDEVLLNPETGVYHLLNHTARSVVTAFDDGSTLEAAVDRLAEDAEVDRSQVQADAELFVRSMLGRGLLEEVP